MRYFFYTVPYHTQNGAHRNLPFCCCNSSSAAFPFFQKMLSGLYPEKLFLSDIIIELYFYFIILYCVFLLSRVAFRRHFRGIGREIDWVGWIMGNIFDTFESSSQKFNSPSNSPSNPPSNSPSDPPSGSPSDPPSNSHSKRN